MDGIKATLATHFPEFKVNDVSSSYYDDNVLKYDVELRQDKKRLYLVEKNRQNALFVYTMSQSVNPFLILQDDNYLTLTHQDVLDLSGLFNRLRRFLSEKISDHPCYICMDRCQNYALCDRCSVVVCYPCVSKLHESSKFKCPQCRSMNALEMMKS